MASYSSSVLRSHLLYSLLFRMEDTTNWELGVGLSLPSTTRQVSQMQGAAVLGTLVVLLLRQGRH
jgi:hypothetical protein